MPTLKNILLVLYSYTADDTAILMTQSYGSVPAFTRKSLLHPEIEMEKLEKWRIKANGTKFVHVTFTTHTDIYPPVTMNGLRIPQAENAKYLGLYLNHRLNWKKHILNERKQLGLQLGKMHRLLGSHNYRLKTSC